jgi:hypothetical protein
MGYYVPRNVITTAFVRSTDIVPPADPNETRMFEVF